MTTLNPPLSIVGRWYIVLLGLAITVAALLGMQSQQPVYAATTQVQFTAPGDATFGPSNDALRGSVVDYVAVVERLVNGRAVDRTSSEDATLYGLGVRDGVRVQLPNSGGQWQNSFAEPTLSVQVVGPDAAEVRTTLTGTLQRIEAVSDRMQVGVASAERVTAATPDPTLVPVHRMGATTSTIMRAWAVLLVVGFCASCAVAVAVDRWSIRRRCAPRAPRTARPHDLASPTPRHLTRHWRTNP